LSFGGSGLAVLFAAGAAAGDQQTARCEKQSFVHGFPHFNDCL
jgi:hypothetical protein